MKKSKQWSETSFPEAAVNRCSKKIENTFSTEHPLETLCCSKVIFSFTAQQNELKCY